MSHKNEYYDQNKSHHTPKGFRNSDPFLIRHSDVKKWRQQRKVYPPEGGYAQFYANWYQQADFLIEDDAVWWLGHATALIKMNHKTILTDPLFSERASPVQFIGPKRHTPCASSIAQLPHIDMIVISHNHYDHLDYRSIRQLIKRFPLVSLIVPLGLKHKMQRWGAKNVTELDWWDSVCVEGITVSSVPARHWSRRTLHDTNRTLWCGWMLTSNTRRVYFMGDTGYSERFAEVKKRFPNIDIALIPIGSYAPRWFMHNQHVDPQQALQLFHDIGCKKAIAIHWGAFELADEPLDEPPRLLRQLIEQYMLSPTDFLTIKIGGSVQMI
ncbi:L-ascorbate metabolism protein UlaG (beta-lactamase superfamily) [Orbus hercynius]|uniref:L-ascorbate metabolism protein UlaG (Beta-lactamase superfamily) n=1 Tax=Orbus hercynius TaxID=593135 RepID=A0A495RIJ9_9GAMM|nr:MBL fold metallo-hydrolase [Orbus hercynius]RKS87362.1 L-ascorbate metabolism protein UlaG (beta-lactamase superfamily) [Orbus hercynius]